jgi:hypothetical protein
MPVAAAVHGAVDRRWRSAPDMGIRPFGVSHAGGRTDRCEAASDTSPREVASRLA